LSDALEMVAAVVALAIVALGALVLGVLVLAYVSTRVMGAARKRRPRAEPPIERTTRSGVTLH
jgi:hypothetical protein